MADNVGYTEGSGKNIATDDVSSVHFQKIKLDQGGDGVSAMPPAHNGPDNGNPIKVGGKFNAVATTLDDGDRGDFQLDANANLKVTLATLIAGEDITTNRLRVEQNNTYSRKTADGQVLSGAGFIHTVTIAPLTAAPTAGLLTIYDSASETGTVVYSEWVFATTPGHTVVIDSNVATGIYVGFDATLANVGCTVAYRAN